MENQRLQDQQESQDTAEERLHAVTRELNETAEIVEEATTTVNCLHAELRNVQDGAQSSKGESVKCLEALEKNDRCLEERIKRSNSLVAKILLSTFNYLQVLQMWLAHEKHCMRTKYS
jgi:hypothetical protein